MQIGKLNTRIIIQHRTPGVDAIGQPIPGNWATLATVWANVRHVSGAQAIKADAPVSTVKASIRIRWRTDLDASMRVLVGATVYEITAVLPEMAKREYVDCVAQVVL